jgi:hypothetical protein
MPRCRANPLASKSKEPAARSKGLDAVPAPRGGECPLIQVARPLVPRRSQTRSAVWRGNADRPRNDDNRGRPALSGFRFRRSRRIRASRGSR